MKTKSIKSKKAIIIILLISFTCIIAAVASVKTMDSGMHEFIRYKIQKELDLNESQMEQLNKIKENIIKEKENCRLASLDEFNELKTSFINGTLEKDTINFIIEEKMKTVQEKIPVFADRIFEIHGILNKDQRVKLVNMINQWHERIKSTHPHSRFKDDEIFSRKMKEYIIEKTQTSLNLEEYQQEWFVSFVDTLHDRKSSIRPLMHENKAVLVNSISKLFVNEEMDKQVLIDTISNLIPFDVVNELKIPETVLEIESNLNQEQRENLFVLLEELKEKHGHKKGHRSFFKNRFASCD